MGTPLGLSNSSVQLLEHLKCGWNHYWKGAKQKGFFIGFDHPPFCDVRVVRSIDPKDRTNYLVLKLK